MRDPPASERGGSTAPCRRRAGHREDGAVALLTVVALMAAVLVAVTLVAAATAVGLAAARARTAADAAALAAVGASPLAGGDGDGCAAARALAEANGAALTACRALSGARPLRAEVEVAVTVRRGSVTGILVRARAAAELRPARGPPPRPGQGAARGSAGGVAQHGLQQPGCAVLVERLVAVATLG